MPYPKVKHRGRSAGPTAVAQSDFGLGSSLSRRRALFVGEAMTPGRPDGPRRSQPEQHVLGALENVVGRARVSQGTPRPKTDRAHRLD